MAMSALTKSATIQGRDRDLLARRLSNAAAASSTNAPTQSVQTLEKRLSRRTSSQQASLPQRQQGRSTLQQNTVALTTQGSGPLDMQPPGLSQPSRRLSKMQSAASGAVRN